MSAEILKLIEAVDPSDAAKMDEIDIKTHCWARNREWGGWHKAGDDMTGSWAQGKDGKRIENSYLNHSSFERLSRSRDALKSIRPKGWHACVEVYYATNKRPEGEEYVGYMTKPDFKAYHPYNSEWITRLEAPKLPTEELAELHAIIQAIEFERQTR